MAKNVLKGTEQSSRKNGGNQYFNLDAEKAFFEEVDEEVRNEKFKQLINKYGGVILVILILALSVAVGYEKIGQWRVYKAEQKNVQYTQALAPNPNYQNNIAELEDIVATEKGLYRDVARLQIANILLDNNQTDKGLATLEQIYNDNDTAEKFREIAAIKLATYKIDSYSYAEIETLLQPILLNADSAWLPMAKEWLAMSAIQNKNYAKAKSIYQELLTDTSISDEFKARINDMLASISDAENGSAQ